MPPRFFRHGELPLVLLAILAQHPRHRYDVMSELTRLFGPRYRASPGSVYPAIDALHTEGLITGRAQGERLVYEVTDIGQAALAGRADSFAEIESRVGIRLLEDSLDTLLARFRARLAPLAGQLNPADAALVLDHAATEIEALAGIPSPDRRRPHAG